MADALVIKGLSKRFGGLRAVQDVSFTVRENETLALIGPNGAGKSTTFNMVNGQLKADRGSIRLALAALHEDDAHRSAAVPNASLVELP